MDKLDPGLRFLAGQDSSALEMLARQSVFNVAKEVDEPATVAVLVQFTGDVSALQAAGLTVKSVAGDVASGQIRVDRLDELEASDAVVRVEASRVLHSELDKALPEANITAVHADPAGYRGTGVIVGIIDSGIDFMHPAFRRDDGTTRILTIWDQGLAPQGSETSPKGFDYGVEFDRSAIDTAIGAGIRHQDQLTGSAVFHGTHVAGIAAGNGTTYVGAAPEAYLVCVANNRGRAEGQLGLGDSSDALDAVRYIFGVAADHQLPAVINMSLGDNIGPHDGTSLLELGIEHQLTGPGRVMVKSAGNEGDSGCHAGGTLGRDQTQWVKFRIPPGRQAPVVVDVWYHGDDRFDVCVASPDGDRSPAVPSGSTLAGALGPDQVHLFSQVDDPGNHDNRILLVVSPSTGAQLTPGDWSLVLIGRRVASGRWDSWIQRSAPSIRCEFLAPFRDPACTISVPGTAGKTITVGSYVSRGPNVGAVSAFSSRGPTRDGRTAPTVAAPGQTIIAPQPWSTADAHGSLQGTSMAAPLVAGAIALMLEKSPSMSAEEVRDVLVAHARRDRLTGTTPNGWWGAGKLDAAAAVASVQ